MNTVVEEDKTKDDMVKLKVDNKDIYLKKVSWEAYLDGKKTATGKVSPTECLMSYLEEEHTTYYENGNIATSSKTKKVEEKRAGGKRTRG